MDYKKSNESSNDLHNSKAEQLKKKANDEYGKGNYDAAIKTYTKILGLPGIPPDLQAIIFSNRSAAFLNKNNITMAINDAKMAIELRPSWWRPYYRLGSAYEAENKLEKAIEQFEAALTLTMNPAEEKSMKEKLYKVRHQFGIESREKCLLQHPELWNEEEQLQKLYKRPKQVQKMLADQKEAESEKRTLELLQQQIEEEKKKIDVKKAEVEKELADVLSGIEEAKNAISSIKINQLVEVRSMASPPTAVKLAVESICLLLGEKVNNWKDSSYL